MPDHPRIIVTISGIPRSGKTVLAKLIQRELNTHKIPHFGPFSDTCIASYDAAMRNLKKRGLSIEFIEEQVGEREQIDATIGFKR